MDFLVGSSRSIPDQAILFLISYTEEVCIDFHYWDQESPDSRRLLNSGRFAGAKFEESGDERPAATRFIAYAPNLLFLFMIEEICIDIHYLEQGKNVILYPIIPCIRFPYIPCLLYISGFQLVFTIECPIRSPFPVA